MTNLVLSYINRADTATLSGGSWQASLPLTNLQQTRLSKAARSTNLLAASTKFDIDLGATTVVLRMIGVMGHNLTQDATYRLTGGDSPGATQYDSGWQAVWPAVYGLWDREFEDPDWYSGKISAAEASAYPIKALLDLGLNYTYRYWRVEFLDTGNAAGYIELARFWFGPAWQPTINYDWGSALGWQSRDRAIEVRSGARIIERMKARRAWRLSLHELSDQEAFGRALAMNLMIGTEGEIVVIPDPADVANYHRRNIYGRVPNWGDGVVDTAYGKQVLNLTVEERL